MKPEFPIRVSYDDGREEFFDTIREIENNLEWFDTDDGDNTAHIVDAVGRPVRLRVEALRLIVCELSE